MPAAKNLGATICIGREIRCFPYVGIFLYSLCAIRSQKSKISFHLKSYRGPALGPKEWEQPLSLALAVWNRMELVFNPGENLSILGWSGSLVRNWSGSSLNCFGSCTQKRNNFEFIDWFHRLEGRQLKTNKLIEVWGVPDENENVSWYKTEYCNVLSEFLWEVHSAI